MQADFEILVDLAGAIRWQLKTDDGEIVATSKVYESEADAQEGIQLAITAAFDARKI